MVSTGYYWPLVYNSQVVVMDNRFRIKLVLALFSGVSLFAFVGCGGQSIPDLPPEEIVSSSVARMQTMPGYSLLIERSGGSAFLDTNETISFRRAEGKYVLPDMVSATVKVVAIGLVAEVEMISIGENQWQTNFLTGEWEMVPPDFGFNPSLLFHPEVGIPNVLANDLSALELTGTEELVEVPGQQLYALRGTLAGQPAYEMSFGLLGPNDMNVTMWIAPGTFELYRLVIVELGVDGEEDTVWLLDFWDFDQVTEISPPIP
jgi:lipoprotein LprG